MPSEFPDVLNDIQTISVRKVQINNEDVIGLKVLVFCLLQRTADIDLMFCKNVS